MSNELTRADEIIESYDCNQANLIAIMQEIQAEYKYLSEETLTLIAEKLGVSTAKVYSVATFYENFSLEAKGRHIVKVCAGTACHVRKSGPIYDAIHDYLGLTGKKKTSADGMFTLETVASLKVSEMLGASLPEEKEGRSHPVKKRQDNKIRKCFFILFLSM